MRHLRTRPYRPETNGKAERFIQTMLLGWAYKRPYRKLQAPHLGTGALGVAERRPAHGAEAQHPVGNRIEAGADGEAPPWRATAFTFRF